MPPPEQPRTWAEYARELGLELQRRRLSIDLSQEDLAHRAGMTRTHYQQIERGQWKPGQPANPSLRVVVRLCQALGLAPSEVLPDPSRVEWPPD